MAVTEMLNTEGVLPPGKHTMTVAKFRQHFVDNFVDSATRQRLFARWQRHWEALSSILTIHSQWIDGSYVTAKLDPQDVDVVSLVDAVAFDALAPGLQETAMSLLSGKATRQYWSVDSYAVLVYPEGHELRWMTDKGLAHWDWFWQRIRDDDEGMKGYVEVVA